MTSDGPWNPHPDVYARNEENMMDWEGNMVELKDRMQILLADIEEDTAVMIAAAQIGAAETKCINDHASSANTFAEVASTRPEFDKIPVELNEVAAVLGNISSVLDNVTLANSLSERGRTRKILLLNRFNECNRWKFPIS